jgi:hypothetical protein
VKEQRWLSGRVPALLEVNAVVRIGTKVTGSVWLDRWVQDLCETHSYSSMTVVRALKKAAHNTAPTAMMMRRPGGPAARTTME